MLPRLSRYSISSSRYAIPLLCNSDYVGYCASTSDGWADSNNVSWDSKDAEFPPVGTEVEVIFDKRLIVTTMEGVEIGYLPTRFNYLRINYFCGFVN